MCVPAFTPAHTPTGGCVQEAWNGKREGDNNNRQWRTSGAPPPCPRNVSIEHGGGLPPHTPTAGASCLTSARCPSPGNWFRGKPP